MTKLTPEQVTITLKKTQNGLDMGPLGPPQIAAAMEVESNVWTTVSA